MDTTAPATTTTATEPATTATTDATAYDGEQLGALVFDVRHVKAGHSGLWVYPAGYSDATLCQGRADHLTESFGVTFHAVPLVRIGDETEWFAATGASNTEALRRHMRRAYDRVRGMAPISGGSTDESEV